MGCKLTVAGKEFVGGVIVVFIATVVITIASFSIGWAQLHIVGLNMVPDGPISSAVMYYIVTGGAILGSAALLLMLTAFVVAVFMHGLPELFTCKKEEQ